MDILITGARGYIGGLLVERLSAESAVRTIVCIDALPASPAQAENPKVHWIQADLAAPQWSAAIPTDLTLDAVIHCAFTIRNPYGAKATQATEENNLAACRNVFSFTFNRNIPKLIYLSSVAAYGAKKSNIGRLLTEETPLSERENPYGYQKAESERILNALIEEKHPATQAFVLRLNSITGPHGQSLESKFGLITFLRRILPFVIQANPAWARQFVHESDLIEAIATLTLHGTKERAAQNPEVFNIAPSTFLTARDMGRILHKAILPVPSWFVKPSFWLAWNLTRGKIPTRPDSYAGLIYPINVNGARIEHMTDFRYAHTAEEALLAKK